MEVHIYLQTLTQQRTISLCWMSTTFYHGHLHFRRCPLMCPSLFAKLRGQPSLRWPRPFHGKSLWIWLPMLGWIYCLHRLLLPPHRENIALICCERQKLTNSTSRTTEFVNKLWLQGQQPVPNPPHSFTLAPQPPQPVPQSPPFFQPATQPTTSVPQPTPQPTRSSSWADKVATEQSGWSILETVVPNWAYSGRLLDPRPLSQSLV